VSNANGGSDLRKIPDPPVQSDSTDRAATQEQKAILGESYEEDRRRQDHHRTQGIKNVAYYGLAALVWFGVLLILMVATVWAFHILAPEHWRWLGKDEIDRLQGLLFSSSLAAAVTLIGKKVL